MNQNKSNSIRTKFPEIECDIYWDDLTPECKKRFVENGINEDELNSEMNPIAIFTYTDTGE